MMIRLPLRLAKRLRASERSSEMNESLTLLVLLGVVFILLGVVLNEFGSIKMFCYDKCLLHGLHPCIVAIKRPGTTR